MDKRATVLEVGAGRRYKATEAGELVKLASTGGKPSKARKWKWTNHPDATALLAHLRAHGLQSYGAAATDLGWGMTRAWQAEARLRAAGLIAHDHIGRAVPKDATE